MTSESLVIPDQADVVGGSLGRMKGVPVSANEGTGQVRASDHRTWRT